MTFKPAEQGEPRSQLGERPSVLCCPAGDGHRLCQRVPEATARLPCVLAPAPRTNAGACRKHPVCWMAAGGDGSPAMKRCTQPCHPAVSKCSAGRAVAQKLRRWRMGTAACFSAAPAHVSLPFPSWNITPHASRSSGRVSAATGYNSCPPRRLVKDVQLAERWRR